MGKKAKITLICCVVAVPLLLIAAFLLFVLPYINAASSMPEGASLAFFDLGGGEYRVEWPEGENATHYKLTIDGESVEDAGVLDENSTVISGAAEGEHVFNITPLGSWSLFGSEHLRAGETLSVNVLLSSPDAPKAEWTPDEDAKTLTAIAEPLVGRKSELRLVEEDGTEHVLASTDAGELVASFGGEGELAMPVYLRPARRHKRRGL